jgi:MFS family permease
VFSVLTRYPDFRRLFIAELIVFGADWFVMVPLLVLLSELTGRGLWGGLVLAVETGVVALLLPYAGTIADRFNRKRILVATNLGALLAVLGLFAVQGPAAGPIALLAVGGLAASKAFYTPAANSALPNLVDPPDLAAAMTLGGASWGTMAVLGSSLGGVISAWLSPYACFVIVAVALAFAAMLSAGIRRPTQEATAVTPRPAYAAIKEATVYLRAQPKLLALVTVKAAAGVGNGLLVTFPLIALSFGVGPRGLGLLFAVRGAGVIVGPFLFRRVLNRPRWLLPGLALSMAAYGVAYAGVALTYWFPLVLVGVFVAHLAGGGNWVMSNFALQKLVPDELRGRVNASDTMIAMLAVTVSQLVVGLFVDSVDWRVLVGCCALTTLTYAVGWRLVTRRLDRPELGMA